MIPHILFKFASRARPAKFYAALDNIISKLANKTDYTILCSLDEDDTTMPAEMVRQKAVLYPSNILSVHGKSANKIHAINRDMHLVSNWDILVNMSDDMSFIVDGFDDIIRNGFARTDGNWQSNYNFDQFLHYNDGNQKDNVATMSIMGRQYCDRFNYIYHPSYKSVWCDVEQTDVAVMLGKYKYMGDKKVIFRHLHPAWGLAEYDAQYRASENLDVWGEDLQNIIKRKMVNYGLENKYDSTQPLYGVSKNHTGKYPFTEIDNWILDLNAARKRANLQPIYFQR